MRMTLALTLMLARVLTLAADVPAVPTFEIKVTQDGFEPSQIKLQKDRPTVLVFKRVTDLTCIMAIDIPAEGVKDLELPLDKALTVTVTPKKAGVEEFFCSAMAMGDGRLIVSD